MAGKSKTRGKAQAKKEFAVIGLGHFGASLARRLEAMGHTVLGVEHVQALFQQAVTRGEVVESDAQQMLDDLHRQLSEGTTSHISSGLAGLLNKLPGVNIAYKAPDAPAQSEGGAPPAAPTAP